MTFGAPGVFVRKTLSKRKQKDTIMSIKETATTIINSTRVAITMLDSACETLGLADALEPDPEEDAAVASYLHVWEQDEESMSSHGVAHSGVFNK